jgi:Vitamin B6 photo-protection and homoeostasis
MWRCGRKLEGKSECPFRYAGEFRGAKCREFEPFILHTALICHSYPLRLNKSPSDGLRSLCLSRIELPPDRLQKDSSQETIISLLGMLAGSLVVSHITTPLATWVSLLTLLLIHLSTNYLAVRAVSMRTLNRQRANFVYSQYLDSLSPKALTHIPGIIKPLGRKIRVGAYDSPVPTPESVSLQERIFERDGVLRWQGLTIMGHCTIGVSLRVILDIVSSPNAASGSYKYSNAGNSFTVPVLFSLYEKESYVLHFAPRNSSFSSSLNPLTPFSTSASGPRFYIIFKGIATTETQLKAWFQAFVCAWLLYSQSRHESQIQGQDDSVGVSANRDRDSSALSMLKQSLQFTNAHWPTLRAGLVDAGWDIEIGALETHSGVRVSLAGQKSE